MDQQKIGIFMKELRKEKELTQEQLADKLNVSRRTVSRWETGNNMPDIDILIDIADLYEIDLRELLNGKRRDQTMNTETKETAILSAEYTNENNKRVKNIYHIMFIVALCFGLLSMVIEFSEKSSHLLDFLRGVGEGMTLGMVIVGALYTSKSFEKISEAKKKALNK